VQLAILSANRNILAPQKPMCTELVVGFIVVILVGIVVENPACVLGITRLLNKATDLVVLTRPTRQ
jgi:hypothetical protein